MFEALKKEWTDTWTDILDGHFSAKEKRKIRFGRTFGRTPLTVKK